MVFEKVGVTKVGSLRSSSVDSPRSIDGPRSIDSPRQLEVSSEFPVLEQLRQDVRQRIIQSDSAGFRRRKAVGVGRERAAHREALVEVLRLIDQALRGF